MPYADPIKRREYYNIWQRKKRGFPKEKKLKHGFSRSENPKEYDRLQKLDKMTRDPLARILATSKYRAKKLGLEFSITREDVIIPKCCPILGIELKFNPGKRQDSTYSLDRIDNSKGYIPGNVAVISWKANRLKNSLQPEQIEKLYNYMKNSNIL